MSRHVPYLLAAIVGSTGLGIWIYHHAASVGAVVAMTDPTNKPRVEIVRVPATTQSSGSTTEPTSQPANRLALPPEYAILQTRNAFMRGGKGPNAAGGPEAGFILRGVVESGDRLIAFVEDKAAKRVLQISSGETVALGKISAINLDGFEYQAGGPARQIKIGQDLNGQVAPSTPTTKPAAPQPGPGQEMPPGAVPPGQPSDIPPGAGPRRASVKERG